MEVPKMPCAASLSFVAAVMLVAWSTQSPLHGQGRAPAVQPSTAARSAPTTPWGDPDLQGIWSNSTITPLERPAAFAGRAFLTEQESAALDRAAAVRGDQRSTNPVADVDGAYNQFWWDRGNTISTRRTSLIVDPEDGRLPPLTEAGRRRAAQVAEAMGRPSHGPEDRNLAERCVTRGAPKLPGGYNNNFHILQTPGYVAILQEMIHEVRIIPLDGRPHLPPTIQQWMGDSRGRWEGDTLVVDTTNYHHLVSFNSFNCCPGAGGNLHIVERYRRVGPDTIDFRFTVNDPTTYSRPFTIELPMQRAEGPVYEYACHEGNDGMAGILSGARALEHPPAAADVPSPRTATGPTVRARSGRVERPGARRPVAPTRPRIAPLPEAQWTDEHRQLVAKYARGGRADNGLQTLLRLPALVDAVMPFTNYLTFDSTISPRHRALLILRTAWLCGSEALWSGHAPRSRDAGLTESEIRRIAQGPDAPGWAPGEATLLRVADQLYRNSAVNDATWTELAGALDLPAVMDAVETVNHFTALAMVYNSLGVQQPDATVRDRWPAEVPYRVSVPEPEPPLAVARITPVPGDGIAVRRTFARHATMSGARATRANFINRVSSLQPRHREMLILRIGWNCRSEYEWAQHVGSVGRAREHGLDPPRIAAGPDAEGWDEFERAILAAVDELYRDATISDPTWNALAARFDPGMMMSAVFAASSYRATSMALNAFGVQLEPGDERFPTLPSNAR
jgi:alkylhydroperoxidase family enzyme